MLLPTKPKNYPLVILDHEIFIVRRFGVKRSLSSPWLRWFMWEATNVADVFIIGGGGGDETFLEKRNIAFTDYIPEKDIVRLGGIDEFIKWLQYGSHPVYILLKDKPNYAGVAGALYYSGGFESAKPHLLDLISGLRKI